MTLSDAVAQRRLNEGILQASGGSILIFGDLYGTGDVLLGGTGSIKFWRRLY